MFTLKTFRTVALIEATSFLLLLIATVIKYTADAQIGVTILGPIHGVLFLTYVLIAVALRDEQGWNGKETVLILLGAVIPFGGYAVDRWLAQRPPAMA